MSGSVNKAILVGRLGRDPESRKTQAGTMMVGLSVATSETWKDKSTGERKERTEWHRIIIFNERCAAFAERYLKKGDMVYLEGALQTRKWTTQEGQDRYSTEIILGQFRGELQGLVSAGGRDEDPSHSEPEREKSDAAPAGQSVSDLDDEIPF